MKTIIRLTESDLHNIIEGCVQEVLGEAKLKKKDPLYYWTRETKCPKCGGKGNPMYGGLCRDCARANNIVNSNKF